MGRKICNKFNEYMSQIIVVFAIAMIITYVVVVLMVSAKGATVPDSLTNGVFGFFGVEMLSLAGIKITKYFKVAKTVEDTFNDIADDIRDK